MSRAWLAAGLAATLLLAAGCQREPTRTVVLSGQGAAAAAARSMGAPASPGPAAVDAPAPAAPASPAPPGAASPAAPVPATRPSAPAAATAGAVSAPAAEIAANEQPSRPTGTAGDGGGDGAALLAARTLVVPVQGVPATALVDMFDDARTGHRHEAIDILAPRGTKVFAADDGTVAKLFNSKPGGLTVYQFDPQGRLAYYYAHLDRYAPGLREGMTLRRGDLIGHVGVSGNAGNTPHLHFAVFRLGPERRWWEGEPINPYPALSRAPTIG